MISDSNEKKGQSKQLEINRQQNFFLNYKHAQNVFCICFPEDKKQSKGELTCSLLIKSQKDRGAAAELPPQTVSYVPRVLHAILTIKVTNQKQMLKGVHNSFSLTFSICLTDH